MNIKRIIAIAAGFLICAGVYAQNKITAVLLDSSNGDAVPFATVSLTKDGAKKPDYYNLSNDNGVITISKVKHGSYTLRAELLGYKAYVKAIKVEGDLNLGEIKMDPDRQMLDAASVSAVGNPIVVKKDTLEYNASSFKTTENDMLEDLLKKLPGVEVSVRKTASPKAAVRLKISFFTFSPYRSVYNLFVQKNTLSFEKCSHRLYLVCSRSFFFFHCSSSFITVSSI